MVLSGDDNDRVSEEDALLDVSDRGRFPHGANQEIYLTAPKARQKVGIWSFQHMDWRSWPKFPKLRDCSRKYKRTRKGHRSDDDFPGFLIICICEVDLCLGEFGKRKSRGLG